uniref:hypothetical protein n=1 Tax=Gracilaria urvillei TaxID=172974 RepID=UPI001D1120A3|nr:hypothetical protein LK147_pgp119 [Hydropuntia urvillei]UAD88421.1 hypothetical protein [Hydropuntia urvillei]
MKYKNILNKLEGTWICQRTNYYIDNNKINDYQKEIQIKKIHTINNLKAKDYFFDKYQIFNKNIQYLFFQPNKSELGKVQQIINNQIKYYKFKICTSNYIKIEFIKTNVIYYEYIYFINSRFRITICILKKNYKYLAISFISEIKIST